LGVLEHDEEHNDFGLGPDAVLQLGCHVNEGSFVGLLFIRTEFEDGIAAEELEDGWEGRCVGAEFLAGGETELDDLRAVVVLQGFADDTARRGSDVSEVGVVDVLLFHYLFIMGEE